MVAHRAWDRNFKQAYWATRIRSLSNDRTTKNRRWHIWLSSAIGKFLFLQAIRMIERIEICWWSGGCGPSALNLAWTILPEHFEEIRCAGSAEQWNDEMRDANSQNRHHFFENVPWKLFVNELYGKWLERIVFSQKMPLNFSVITPAQWAVLIKPNRLSKATKRF